MIELFTADTPNGWKISIMLEEIDFKYKLTKVNLSGDQFKPEFKKISPFNNCLLYTSPSPRDRQKSRMPSSA